MKNTKYLRWSRVFIVLGAVLIAIQLVPYGRWHVNPPVVAEPRWDSPQTRALAQRACFDCHSNETEWPFYARVAPASWLLQYDVVKGRAELNFSEWQRPQKEAREAPEVLREREMPPLPYRLVHGHARLTPAERELLAAGLTRSLGVRTHGETARR